MADNQEIGYDDYSSLQFDIDNNTIYLTGGISSETSESFLQIFHAISKNEEIKKDLTIYINSPGGVVIDTLAIYDMLRNYKKIYDAKITTISYGFCASGAVLIALAGDLRFCLPNTVYFLHDIQYNTGSCDGLSVISAAHLVDHHREIFRKIIENETKKPLKEGIIRDDTYLTADTALEMGFVDEIIDNGNSIALCIGESE